MTAHQRAPSRVCEDSICKVRAPFSTAHFLSVPLTLCCAMYIYLIPSISSPFRLLAHSFSSFINSSKETTKINPRRIVGGISCTKLLQVSGQVHNAR